MPYRYSRTEAEAYDDDYPAGTEPGDCAACAPFACDDPDAHLGPPPGYGPPPGCRCSAWRDGRDCMCYEEY